MFLSRPPSLTMNSTIESFPEDALACMIVAVSFSLTVSLPANAFVLWLIQRGARLVPDIFYFNLSLDEILISLLMTWGLISVQFNCMPCIKPYAFFSGLFLTARPLFQFLIVSECYMGVNHPVLFLRLKPLRYRLTCCIGAWLLNFASCVYYKYTHTNTLYLFIIVVQNLLLLLAVILCLLSVLWTLRRPVPGVNFVPNKRNKAKIRAFKIISVTLACMTLNFFLSIGPIPVQFYMPQQTFQLVYTICNSLSLIIGSIQPVIYLRRAQKIVCPQLH